MSLWLCLWPNKDVSFINAPDIDSAALMLDEVGNAHDSAVRLVDLGVEAEFQLHLRWDKEETVDNGELITHYEFDGFGEATELALDEFVTRYRRDHQFKDGYYRVRLR